MKSLFIPPHFPTFVKDEASRVSVNCRRPFFMKEKEEKKSVSSSYVMGIVALVFLIIGYQTALFIHTAAVTRIASNRDNPDTVYIYQQAQELSMGSKTPDTVTVRKEYRASRHHPKAEAVRRNLPGRRVETFSFDPNTVTIDELCRLGFSAKQAQSIDNYRKKGGRFRRKEDFSRSFVVADSVYARLEDYIDIPLVDLNKADSAAFDSLPGIGGWYASKMLEYRDRLGGYSYKEQLMDIYNFDRERFEALEDLITVSKENQKPYPIWTLPADSLKLHPYIGTYSASAIVLSRENNPREKWTIEELDKAGILRPEHVGKLSRCVLALP